MSALKDHAYDMAVLQTMLEDEHKRFTYVRLTYEVGVWRLLGVEHGAMGEPDIARIVNGDGFRREKTEDLRIEDVY